MGAKTGIIQGSNLSIVFMTLCRPQASHPRDEGVKHSLSNYPSPVDSSNKLAKVGKSHKASSTITSMKEPLWADFSFGKTLVMRLLSQYLGTVPSLPFARCAQTART